MKLNSEVTEQLRVSNHKFKLSDYSTVMSSYNVIDRDQITEMQDQDMKEISRLQNILYAENNQSLLIILQGMDSSGKDGTIKHILRGVNPQGVKVVSFKHPSTQELEHDYLWRHAINLPEHGQITIFNRSYYENVLISKVHPELVLAERIHGYTKIDQINNDFWDKRYNQIKQFESHNLKTGTQILKFFLYLSIDQQAQRFLERIANKDKHWKFSSDDIEERKFWHKYQKVYQQAIKHTSTKHAPWYVIPADDKLYAHFLISRIILEKLMEMNPTLPPKTLKEIEYMNNAKLNLERELIH